MDILTSFMMNVLWLIGFLVFICAIVDTIRGLVNLWTKFAVNNYAVSRWCEVGLAIMFIAALMTFLNFN